MLLFCTDTVLSQTASDIRGMHKVKRKETIFGISRRYNVTIEELIKANPEMNEPGYELKKDAVLRIPYGKAFADSEATSQASRTTEAKGTVQQEKTAADDLRNRVIRLGVMLPLHDINGDGRRMVEYYRGVLMACDSLKHKGISIDVHAWNTAEDDNLEKVLADPAAAKCDIIIGPLYSKQMEVLSAFVTKHDIRLVIPFSINAPQLYTNRNIFQIYQTPNDLNEATINRFLERFHDYHAVFIDCNDSTSKKGVFTFGLRRRLESRGIEYAITNLKSNESLFAKAFSTNRPNVVILNTGRSPELNVAFAKLSGLRINQPSIQISLFGYTEWLLYTKYQLDNFYKFDTYIPSTFFYNPLTQATTRFEQNYRDNFHQDMMNAQPRFAITGFDQAYFFLLGLHTYGKSFNGAKGMFGYPPVQTPLEFERIGNGGLQNRKLLFVHYTPEHRVETVK